MAKPTLSSVEVKIILKLLNTAGSDTDYWDGMEEREIKILGVADAKDAGKTVDKLIKKLYK